MTNVKRWAAWAEKRIAGVVVAEGLHVGLLGVVQGPLVVTFRLRLLRPSPAALRKLLGVGPALAQALQVESVRITDTAQGVLVEVPSPQPRTPSAAHLARYGKGVGVAVGLDQWRRPVGVDLRHHPTLLFVGPSRRGKTQAMKSVLYALARNNNVGRLQFAIFSAKRADWAAFDHLTACWGVVSDQDETALALEWAAGTLLQDRARSGVNSPAVVLVLDDLLNLLKRCPEAAGPIGEIASMGGGVGLYQLIGTQDAGSKRGTGGADVEANITARIVYRASSATTAARAAGAGGVGVDSLSGHKGDALAIIDGDVRRIATAWADDRDIAQLPAGVVTVAPWLQSVVEQPATTAHNRSQPTQPAVVSPIPGVDVATRGAVDGGRGPAVAAVATELFPIEKRQPTTTEARAIAELHAGGESLSAICRIVYGFKDGATFAWVKDAISLASDKPGNSTGNFDNLDLSTEEGRRTFEEMQRSGLIKLPDVSGLFIEGD